MTADRMLAPTPGQPGPSLKRLARIAGLLYLIVGVFGGFAIMYVTAAVYVPGDAATTAANVLANAGLVRVGVVADLLQATVFVFLAMTLYLVLKDVHRNAANAMVILVAIATTIMCLNKVFRFAALRVAGDESYAAAFGAAASNAIVLLLLDIHHSGFLIAQIFFGLWLVPLGYFACKSGMFPKTLGAALIVGASRIWWMCSHACWPRTSAPASMLSWASRPQSRRSGLGYLLVKGVNSSLARDRASAAVRAPVPAA
jgi:Domain of unknown function (DUF4386)